MQRMTRKDFIKKAAAGAAIVAGAGALAGCTGPTRTLETTKTVEIPDPTKTVETAKTVEIPNPAKTVETTKYACLWCPWTREFYDRKSLESHIISTHPGKGFGPIPVAINISSIENKDQLKRRADELIKRGFFCTIDGGRAMDVVGGDYIKELSQAGFDISAQAKIDPDLSYDEKLAETRSNKEALELILGTEVRSYATARQFAIDQDTAAIIAALGGGYIHSSSRSERFPDYALEPVQDPAFRGVIHCYQQSRGIYNYGTDLWAQELLCTTGSNCDSSAQEGLDGPQWAQFQKHLVDQRIKDGKPLTITFHGSMDVKGKAPSEQWFEAFIQILDYMEEKEAAGKIRVMTLAGLTDLYFPYAPVGCCGEQGFLIKNRCATADCLEHASKSG